MPAGSPRDRELLTSERVQTEVYPLTTFAIGGMMLFVAANDLLVMFVALEVLSLPLYLISGLARRRRLLSQEAAVKYFLLGAFASAFFLYGLALVYGATGSVRLGDIRAAAVARRQPTSCWCSAWRCWSSACCSRPASRRSTPGRRTSTRAPRRRSPRSWRPARRSPRSGRSCGCSTSRFGTSEWTWRPLIYGVAIVSMVVGAVLGLTQTDLKRMLAYSSIAHAGLPPDRRDRSRHGGTARGCRPRCSTCSPTASSRSARSPSSPWCATATARPRHLSQWAGLASRSPLTAAVMSLFLLALAGIPLTAGFTGKFAVFRAAIEAGAWPLVLVALLASAVAAFFYLRVIVLMYFSPPAADGPTVGVPGLPTTLVLAITATATLALGIVPGAVLDLAEQAAIFVG